MSEPLARLSARLDYSFRDTALLERAVTHPSFLQDHPTATESNQRLEFLGDAVLQILIAEDLYGLFPTEAEGLLSRRRALLVNRSFLAGLAREIGLAECLLLGASEESTGGRTRLSALGDAFEALVGAVYLDSDLEHARHVVRKIYGPLSARLDPLEANDNPKGRLQEIVQPLHGNDALRYEVTGTDGADHARAFEVAVFLLDRKLGTGRGTSKKLAEEAAARAALDTLKSS